MGSVCFYQVYTNILLRKLNNMKILSRNLKQMFVPKNDVVEFYQKTFDISKNSVATILKENPRLKSVDSKHLTEVLTVLESLNINKMEAINDPAVFIFNANSVKNHWKILKECGFLDIKANHIIRYYAIMKNNKIQELKNSNLLPSDLDVYKTLLDCFSDLPSDLKECSELNSIHHDTCTLDSLRMHVMQFYLEWKFDIKKDKFSKITKHYHQFRHRPLKDVEESISIAINEINIPRKKILSYPYVISSDPVNTRKILDEVRDFNGIDAREVLRTRPGLIRSNYKSILRIKNILTKHNIPLHIQKRALPLYTLKPETVELRLNEMKKNKFYNALSTSNSALLMVLYKNRVISRFDYINNVLNRRCAQLYQLLSCGNNFESKINKFGDTCSQTDVCHTVLGLLLPTDGLSEKDCDKKIRSIRLLLSQHNNWLCVSIYSIVDTVNFLLQHFTKEEIFNNCHLILYSTDKVKLHFSVIQDLKNRRTNQQAECDDESNPSDSKILNNICVGSFNPAHLTNNQFLSLILYSIEKEHSFSGDGIWDTQENQSTSSLVHE